MRCPACGHSFHYMPKMTYELKLKIGALLMNLEKFKYVHGGEITSRQLCSLIYDTAESLGRARYEMGTARLRLQAWGVLLHALNGVGGPVRSRWVIDLEKIEKLKKECQ